MAKNRLREELHKLTKYRVADDTVSSALFGLLEDKATEGAKDRTIAVVATTYLENVLRKAITAHLHVAVDEKRIFEDDLAPLRDFSARIRMARGLGIVNDETEQDLNRLRSIRNVFAHSVENITFSTEAIAKNYATLNVVESQTYKDIAAFSFSPASMFVVAVTIIYWRLVDHKPHWAKKTLAELIADKLPTPGMRPPSEPDPSRDTRQPPHLQDRNSPTDFPTKP